MNYLTSIEKKRVIYSNRFIYPPRKLSDIEKEIARLILVYRIHAEGTSAIVAKNQEIERSLDQLAVLTCSRRLGDKFRAAMEAPEKFEEFTEGYPYPKYDSFINGDYRLSPVEQLAKDGFTEDDIRGLFRWIGMLLLTFHQDLPKGIDTFIWTPYTRWYRTSDMARCSGDKAFYGYTLPAKVQEHINVLFADKHGQRGSTRWAMEHVRRLGLHKDRSVWNRFNMGHLTEDLFDKGVEMNFGDDSVRFSNHSSQPYWFLEVKQESTNTRLRFIVEG